MKKVLIVSYYWPPAGGPGVQRWLKFAKYLPEFGVAPIVYVPKNPTYPIVDIALEAEVPAGVEVIREPIWEPYKIAKSLSGARVSRMSSGIIPEVGKQSVFQRLALWLRGNLFIPDARVFWVGPSVKRLEKFLAENPVDAVITTGPPHSLHLIGLELKKRMNVRWIADFRDPWTQIGYHKSLRLSAFAQKRHKGLEAAVLQTADEIIVTSPATKADFESITTKPITVITNGYDTYAAGKPTLDTKFSVAHIGSLLRDRNPEALWQAISELRSEDLAFAAAFELKLIGTVSEHVLEELHRLGLGDSVRHMGYISHKEALVEQRRSQVLLLIEIDRDETRCIIPGKLFEYMVSGRPIIGIGPENADFAQILSQTNTGNFYTYGEKMQLKSALKSLFERFQNGTLHVHAVGLQQYSRRELTKALANLIHG